MGIPDLSFDLDISAYQVSEYFSGNQTIEQHPNNRAMVKIVPKDRDTGNVVANHVELLFLQPDRRKAWQTSGSELILCMLKGYEEMREQTVWQTLQVHKVPDFLPELDQWSRVWKLELASYTTLSIRGHCPNLSGTSSDCHEASKLLSLTIWGTSQHIRSISRVF